MSAHPIDRLAPVGYRMNRRARVFPGGWGDASALDLLEDRLTAADPIPEIAPSWGRKEEHRGYRVRRGQFTSPAAEAMPPEARAVTVEWVEPSSGSERLVVLLPAWNDEGFTIRRRLAVDLAERGVGALIPDVPFYAARRVRPDREPAIATVGDFVVMAHGAVAEGRALVGMAGGLGTAGVAGFSMGGSLAAAVSATVARPVATAPLAAAHGPGPVFVEGPLRTAIHWSALGGRDAKDRLVEMLGRASVLHLPRLAHHPSAVVVSGARDGIVAPAWTRDLASHWGAELRTVERAGHGTLWWRNRRILADAVRDAFDRLEGDG